MYCKYKMIYVYDFSRLPHLCNEIVYLHVLYMVYQSDYQCLKSVCVIKMLIYKYITLMNSVFYLAMRCLLKGGTI